ncbi:MAG TPA: HDIG domain-containing protein [Anaerolineae bacterium]|nr:HDIG domain-containing protein [Anaerolineae bacterium]HQH37311.1 HDIG domain-containing protein [Anaerolineae bacterium]
MWPTREEAWKVLNEYTQNPHLIAHALAVEAGMKAYARRFDEDEERWAVVGLIHDFEYERYPDLGAGGHPFKGAEIMRAMGWDESLIRAVAAHAPELTGVTPDTPMEKALYAVDELTGLITATALVRPSKSILDVQVNSVRKKWKDKAFAAGVKREDIERGAARLGVELSEHIGIVLEAMQAIAAELGLEGTPA